MCWPTAGFVELVLGRTGAKRALQPTLGFVLVVGLRTYGVRQSMLHTLPMLWTISPR